MSKYSCTICPTRSFDIFILSQLCQLHFTIIQNYFVDFFDVLVGNSLFRASTACIVLDAQLALFKFSKPLLNG
jgi:hypothetical protein